MEKREIKSIIKKLYDAVEKSGWSAYDCTAMFCVLGNVTKNEWED